MKIQVKGLKMRGNKKFLYFMIMKETIIIRVMFLVKIWNILQTKMRRLMRKYREQQN